MSTSQSAPAERTKERTALDAINESIRANMLEKLLEAWARADAPIPRDDYGWTPLHTAMVLGDEAMVALVTQKQRHDCAAFEEHGYAALIRPDLWCTVHASDSALVSPDVAGLARLSLTKEELQSALETYLQVCERREREIRRYRRARDPTAHELGLAVRCCLQRAHYDAQFLFRLIRCDALFLFAVCLEMGASPIEAHPVTAVTPLAYACSRGNHEAAALLLRYGANPDEPVPLDAKRHAGKRPLHISAERLGEHAGCIRVLLDHGADPNARELRRGNTPLTHMAQTRVRPPRSGGFLVNKLRYLIDAGADPNDCADDGRWPILARLYAWRCSYPEKDFVLRAGANVQYSASFLRRRGHTRLPIDMCVDKLTYMRRYTSIAQLREDETYFRNKIVAAMRQKRARSANARLEPGSKCARTVEAR